MVLVVCGNFEPQNILEEIKKRLKPSKNIGEIHRIYEEEQQGKERAAYGKYLLKELSDHLSKHVKYML